MDCIDLKERFGGCFKVKYEESYYAQYGPNARTEDPWYMIIPCKNGHICPWGGSNLAACTNSAGRVANKLKARQCSSVLQVDVSNAPKQDAFGCSGGGDPGHEDAVDE